MRNPLSNSQPSSWMQRALAKCRGSFQRASLVRGRLGPSPSWMIGLTLFFLVAGWISLAALARAKSAAKEGAPSTAAAATAKVKAPPAKARQKHDAAEPGNAVTALKEKKEEKASGSESNGAEESKPEAASQQESVAAAAKLAAGGEEDEEDANLVRARADWFPQFRESARRYRRENRHRQK